MKTPKFNVGDIIISYTARSPTPLMVTELLEDDNKVNWYMLHRVDGGRLDFPNWLCVDIDNQCRLLA